MGLREANKEIPIKVAIYSGKKTHFSEVGFFEVFKEGDFFVKPQKLINYKFITEGQIRKFNRINLKRGLLFLDYQDSFYKEINSQINSLSLPKNYACIHVRRGDKVKEKPSRGLKAEDLRYEIEDYLNRLPQKKSLENIFIMTDDYKAIKEIKNYLKKTNSNKKIHYLTKKTQDGNSEQFIEQGNQSVKKSDLVQFFTEIEVAKNSQVFIGSGRSNVFNHIRLTSKKTTKFINIAKNKKQRLK